MKKAEVVTISAETGVPAVEIRQTSRGKSAKPAPKSTGTNAKAKEAARKAAEKAAEREKKFAEVLESASAGASASGKKPKQERVVAFLDEKPTNGAGVREKSAAEGAAEAEVTKRPRKNAGSTTGTSRPKKAAGTGTTHTGSGSTKRAKARKPNEKLTPASIYRRMLAFGKSYQIENEQDFQEAARIFADEAGLIDQMRDQIAEEGLTVMKTYKTGDVPVAHPLLSELPRHVESANKCLATIGNMVSERGARVEKAARELDAFRLHAR